MTAKDQKRLTDLHDALRSAQARLRDLDNGIEWLESYAPRCTDGAASRLADARCERMLTERRIGEIRVTIGELKGGKGAQATMRDGTTGSVGKFNRQPRSRAAVTLPRYR